MIFRKKPDLRKWGEGILHLNTAKTWRGGEQQVLYLAEQIQKNQGRQIVAGQPGSELQKRCLEKNIPFFPVRMFGEIDIFAAKKIAAAAQANNLGILHAHTAKAHSLALLAKKYNPDLKLIVSRRVDFPAGRGYFSRKKYLSPLVDMYLAISENVRRILESDGIPRHKIEIAYSGIDLTRFKSLPDPEYLRKEFAIRPGEIILGNVAALVDHKDQKTLIRAFHILKGQGRSKKLTRLFILGEGELRKKLAKLAWAGPARNSIVFTGFRRDVNAFLNLFDIFVMSSKEEGLGTAVLDAMACGLPVAATEGGGIPEMIDDEKGGYLVQVGAAEALAGALAKLVESEALRNKYGNYNKKRVHDFSCESTYEATVRAYLKLTGNY